MWAAGLTKEEIAANPQGMLDVLGFYTDGQGGPPAPGNAPSDAGKYMTSSPGPVSLGHMQRTDGPARVSPRRITEPPPPPGPVHCMPQPAQPPPTESHALASPSPLSWPNNVGPEGRGGHPAAAAT